VRFEDHYSLEVLASLEADAAAAPAPAGSPASAPAGSPAPAPPGPPAPALKPETVAPSTGT
jgi:hypothetical protein